MSQVITAYYDSREEAERVQNRLRELGIVKDNADTHSSGGLYHSGSTNYRAGHYSSAEDRGFWSSADHSSDDYLIPDEDRHAYEEGVHRGGAVLTVTVHDQMAQQARDIIEQSNAEDIDTKASEWRNSGWNAPASAAAGTVAGSRYYDRDTDTTSTRYRSYRRTDIGNGPGETSYKASGMANEAIGNVKQAVGSAVGSESLHQSGLAQERKGEAQQQTGEQLGNRGNEL